MATAREPCIAQDAGFATGSNRYILEGMAKSSNDMLDSSVYLPSSITCVQPSISLLVAVNKSPKVSCSIPVRNYQMVVCFTGCRPDPTVEKKGMGTWAFQKFVGCIAEPGTDSWGVLN